MKVIEPNTIDYTSITSSIPEDSAAVWDSATTYAADAVVRIGMYLYKSLQASNTGHNPPQTLSGLDAWWRRTGPTNKAAMFDDKLYTKSIAPVGVGTLTVTVPWTRTTSSFAILAMEDVSSVSIEIKNTAGTVFFSKTYGMVYGVKNWWQYYSGSFTRKTEIVGVASTPMITGTITATFTGGRPEVGHFMTGRPWEIGATLYGVTPEIVDYSQYSVDDFGETTIVKRAFAKRYSGELYLHPSQADSTFNRLVLLRGKPCLWIGDNRTTSEGGFECLNAFGYFKRAPLAFKGPNEAQYSIEIEGMI